MTSLENAEEFLRHSARLGRQRVLILAGITLAAISGIAIVRLPTRIQQPTAAPKTVESNASVDRTPRTLAELIALAANGLSGVDIALMNLLCAVGLRGAENLDIPAFVERLDGLAGRVELETRRHLYTFRDQPEVFEHSEAYFRMLYLFTVLQADAGIRYNPERATAVGDFEPNEMFFADSRDVFIHGLIAEDRRLGTCASLPVVYVAVGRRLGYPLKLVPTKNHLFVRWEDNRERINFDATGRGLNVYDDNHYRQWPFPVSEEEEREYGYLKSMTATEELTVFLALRGHCLMAAGKLREGVAAHETALRISPDSRLQQMLTAMARKRLEPAGSPYVFLPPEQREWPWETVHPGEILLSPNPLHTIRTSIMTP